MSVMFQEPFSGSSRAAYERQVWGEFFGGMIRSARETRSLSVEETCRAAGMAVAEWEGMEAGAVPRTREQLKAVAFGLGIEWQDLAGVVWLCRQAWER